MNNDHNNDMIETRINELIDKSLEESITAEEFAELNQIIASDKKYASYYMLCMKYRQTLYKAQSLIKLPVESSTDQMLQKMAEYETVAPAITVKKEPVKPAAQTSIDTQQVKIVHNVNKPFVILTMLSLAAMILLLVFVQMNPYVNPEVVTVVDSMNARYADPELKIPAGSRLSTKFGLISLKQGIVKLLYDNNVEVIIEAPAEYELKSSKDLYLYSGKTFTTVPQTGKGFTIRTPHSRIIDLGTQFGVATDSVGDTEVHVFKGKTMVVSGIQKESILNLLAGSAKKVCNNGDTVNDIQVNPNAFVQEIDSQTGFIWRGENVIPLTNLLAGDIFNASPSGIEIDPAMGKHVVHENFVAGIERNGQTEYKKMDSPFVDGTFVPLGEQPQIISSTKLSCQFPKTSGSFHYNLSDRKTVYDGYTASNYPLYLTPSSQDKPLIFLHPNMGITIDLDKIRQKMSSFVLEHFRATCGIAPCAADALKKAYPDGNIPAKENPSMNFCVLLDGKASQTLTGIGLSSGVQNINVEIHPTDRFLTLVSTDGNQCFKYDWFILANPVLEISAAQ